MFHEGDIVRFKDPNQWSVRELGIVESKYAGNMYQVRFEVGDYSPEHFTLPVLEDWIMKVSI
jgi:hypothetical protein